MGIDRIIVAIDFSEGADAGLRRGMALAERHDAELILLHVCGAAPNMANAADAILSGPDKLARLHELRVARARELLAAALERAKKHRPQARTLFREGPAAEQIAQAAEDEDADLVVLGALGLRGQQIFPIGSVTEAVVRRATRNVLVVRGGTDPAFERVVIATDLSPASQTVIPNAFDLAASGADFELIHVVDWGDRPPPVHGPAGSPKDDFERLWQGTLDESTKELDTLVERMGAHGPSLRHVVVEGVPASELLERAPEGDEAMLVVGKHLDAPPTHDSVAERLVRQAPCSVLVARRPMRE